jgi:hypothetical protein
MEVLPNGAESNPSDPAAPTGAPKTTAPTTGPKTT